MTLVLLIIKNENLVCETCLGSSVCSSNTEVIEVRVGREPDGEMINVRAFPGAVWSTPTSNKEQDEEVFDS